MLPDKTIWLGKGCAMDLCDSQVVVFIWKKIEPILSLTRTKYANLPSLIRKTLQNIMKLEMIFTEEIASIIMFMIMMKDTITLVVM